MGVRDKSERIRFVPARRDDARCRLTKLVDQQM